MTGTPHRVRPVGPILAGLAALGISAAPLAATPEDCRPLRLIVEGSGAELRGVEDIVVDVAAGLAYLSAYDRWAVEDAIAEERTDLPQGGIYALRLASLRRASGDLPVSDLSAQFKTGSDFHPHGIALHRAADGRVVLFVINRRYERREVEGELGWRLTPAVEVFDLRERRLHHRATVEHPLMCSPNDLDALDPHTFFVTNDHGTCGGFGAWLEEVLGLERSYLLRVALAPGRGEAAVAVAAEEIAFANGVAVGPPGPDRLVYLSATRGKAVLAYRLADLLTARPATAQRRFPLAGGPDNLTWLDGANLLVPMHPDLLDLGLYLKRWFGVDSAPARVTALNVSSGAVTELYDDPTGDPLSAATVAAPVGDQLLIGSVAGDGVLLCPATTVPSAPTAGGG